MGVCTLPEGIQCVIGNDLFHKHTELNDIVSVGRFATDDIQLSSDSDISGPDARSLKVTDTALDSVTDMRKMNGVHDDGEPQPVRDTDIPRAARSAETASTNTPNVCH